MDVMGCEITKHNIQTQTHKPLATQLTAEYPLWTSMVTWSGHRALEDAASRGRDRVLCSNHMRVAGPNWMRVRRKIYEVIRNVMQILVGFCCRLSFDMSRTVFSGLC